MAPDLYWDLESWSVTRTELQWDRKNQRGKRSAVYEVDELTRSPRVQPATVSGRTHALRIGQVIPVMILWRAATVSILRA